MWAYIFQICALLTGYIAFIYYETHSYLRERLVIRTALPKEDSKVNLGSL